MLGNEGVLYPGAAHSTASLACILCSKERYPSQPFSKNFVWLISTYLRVLSQRTISIFTMATKISHVAVLDSGFLTHLSCSFLDRNSICWKFVTVNEIRTFMATVIVFPTARWRLLSPRRERRFPRGVNRYWSRSLRLQSSREYIRCDWQHIEHLWSMTIYQSLRYLPCAYYYYLAANLHKNKITQNPSFY